MYFSPFPCSLVPLRSKYSPQHPILKHPRPTFLPQCEFSATDNFPLRPVLFQTGFFVWVCQSGRNIS
jgi:hypothetical protein